MLKKVIAAVLASVGGALYAGFVDHGDYTGFPNVNVDAHLMKIAHKYFPEISGSLPDKGLPRKAAWSQDIRKAAAGLNVKQSVLDAMVNAILDPLKAPLVKAPHENLLEFELYAAGLREISITGKADTVHWKRILELPLEKRRYTTIPVLYQSYRVRRDWSYQARKKPIAMIKAALDAGCVDTQCCYEAMFTRSVFPGTINGDSIDQKKMLFRKYFVNFTPHKRWRHTNEMDSFLPTAARGDGVYAGKQWMLPDFIYSIVRDPEDSIREMCSKDPVIRDLVVAIGLTNWQLTHVRKIAFEFALQSKINYPLFALRMPPAEALVFLKNLPEHSRLRDLLLIKLLKGEEKIKAIDAYIAKYPDYTPADMPKTSIALNTHAELHALAGAELFRLGRPLEAAERWTKGCTPEDIGLVTEQVMSIEQLIAFCEKHFPEQILQEYVFYSNDCSRNGKLPNPDMVLNTPDEIGACVRNILARRLMRAGRYAEAQKYFSGIVTRNIATRFFNLSKVAASSSVSKIDKLTATLNMAAMLKQHGDIIFGTFLEPDNLLSRNIFPCVWGTKQTAVKLKKPDLPRKHYMVLAAKLYAEAAEMTDDIAIKKNALWLAGTLTSGRDKRLSVAYFKKLLAIAPELTGKNSFLDQSKVPAATLNFYMKRRFINSSVTAWNPPLPEIVPVALPKIDQTPESLVKYGKKLLEQVDDDLKTVQLAVYVFRLAGEKGSVEGDVYSSIVQYIYFKDYVNALAFLRRAEQRAPQSNLVKHELAHVYHTLGYWEEGIKLFRHVADTETANQKLLSLACYNLANLYENGTYGVPKDPALAKHYYEKAKKAESLQPEE